MIDRARPALPPNAKLRKDGRIEIRVQVGGRWVSRYARTPEDAWQIYAELEVERSRGRSRRSGWTVTAWLERREAEARAPGWQEEGWLIPASTGRMLLHTNIRRDFLKTTEAAGSRGSGSTTYATPPRT